MLYAIQFLFSIEVKKMKKTRVLIAGFGNVGRGVLAAIGNNPDMELAGIISRSPERVAKEVSGVPILKYDDVAGFLGLRGFLFAAPERRDRQLPRRRSFCRWPSS